MATAVYMPKQGMSMEEGTLIRWLKNVGDPVELNEPIMEIETDKITMEAEAPATGYLIATLVGENTVVPVLQTIGWIGEKDEVPPAADVPAAASSAAEAESAAPAAAPAAAPQAAASVNGLTAATPYARKLAAEQGVDLSQVKPSGAHGEVVGADVKASSVARRMAEANGLDLAGIQGSGHDGKIMKADVERVLQSGRRITVDHSEKRSRLSGMRKVISERMLKSASEIPSAVLMMSADVTELLEVRAKANAGVEKENKLTINDFVVRATAKALAQSPEFRTRLEGNELVSFDYVNLGVAIGVNGGLLVPVVQDADKMTLSEISAAVKDLVTRAKNNKLSPDEMKGSCFSVSNLGSYGVDFSTPIINQPDSGILGVGGIRDELSLENGQVVVRKMMGLSLTFDHRINDGVPAAQFLGRIKALLENPISILI